MSTEITPFRIAVGDDVLDDLKSRLRSTRWPEAELVDDWSQGVPLKWIQDICRYWAEATTGGSARRALNRFAQFTTGIDGLDIHFLHVALAACRGDAAGHHAWLAGLDRRVPQGDRAADRSDRASAAMPPMRSTSLPVAARLRLLGQADDDRLGRRSHRRAWAVLMDRLGYARYGAQGGDWGSAVTTAIGALDAAHCAGIHITLAMSARPNVEGEPTPEEARALKGIKYYADWDSGLLQAAVDPAADLGYGLTDSPAGQAAWILEKFWAWTDCDGHPENILGRDELLDNVMLYWVTATAASSARLYWESFGPKRRTRTRSTCRPASRCFPGRSSRRCGGGWRRASATSSTGAKCRRAATSLRSNSPSCSSGGAESSELA